MSRPRAARRCRRRQRSIAVAAVILGAGLSQVGAATADESVVTPVDTAETIQARTLRGLRTEVVAQVFGGDEGGELELAVLAVPLPGSGDGAPLALFVEIDGASFLQHHQGDVARLELYVYALDGEGRVADFLAEVFVVDVAELGERIWQSGLEVFGGLELGPGAYRLRVLVRNFHSRASGLETLEVEVPPPGELPRALTPLVPEPAERDGWLPVRSWAGAARTVDAYPLAALGESMNPSARPVLVTERRQEARLALAGAADEVTSASLVLTAVADGETAATVPVEVSGRRPAPAGDVELLDLSWTTPEVAPGFYRAAVVTAGGERAHTSPPLAVAVVPAETRERGLLWSDLRWLLGAAERAAEAPPTAPAPRAATQRARRREARALRGELASGYRQVLARLAGGAAEAARGELFELEAGVAQGDVGERLASLAAAELSVAAALGKGSADRVVPLVLLHSQMYERYRGRRQYTLLAHTRELLTALVDLYLELDGEPALAAGMLANLAGALQEANLIGGSGRLFERALELDPESVAALLGLAATLEKYGEYYEAVGYLERLVAAAPEHDEGRLRLAVNLDRLGLRRRARELFERLAAGSGGDWVRAVAFQETARILLQTGAVGRAAELLEAAVVDMPRCQGHHVLLAHAYDRLGRTREALTQLSLARGGGRRARSERMEYDVWPHADLERMRETLAARGRAALDDLAVMLAQTAEGT